LAVTSDGFVERGKIDLLLTLRATGIGCVKLTVHKQSTNRVASSRGNNQSNTAVQYESGGSHDNIGYWFHPEDWAAWDFKVKRPGTFIVTAKIATPALTSFELSVAGQTFRCAAPVTDSFNTYQTVTLATIVIPTTGKFTVAVHPIKGGWQPMNLKSIELKPAAANP
jgi:hypothetical protein